MPVVMRPYATVALVGRSPASGIAASLSEVAAFLIGTGRDVLVETDTALHLHLPQTRPASLAQIGQQADVAIVLGGDGTMLGVARQLAAHNVPMIGINQGRLGFMTDIPVERMIAVLTDMLDGLRETEQRSLLEGAVWRDGEQIFAAMAVNDVVVSRGAGSGMIELRVEVDGHTCTTSVRTA